MKLFGLEVLDFVQRYFYFSSGGHLQSVTFSFVIFLVIYIIKPLDRYLA